MIIFETFHTVHWWFWWDLAGQLLCVALGPSEDISLSGVGMVRGMASIGSATLLVVDLHADELLGPRQALRSIMGPLY